MILTSCSASAGLSTENDKYWFFHHTDGDTMDVLDSRQLDLATALWTAVSYVAADLSVRLPHVVTSDSD